jgi:hypothetical protein
MTTVTSQVHGNVLTIGAVGDVLIHRELQVQASQSALRFRELWKHVAPLMKAVDVTYANMEGPMASTLINPTSLKEECEEIETNDDLYFDGKIYTGYSQFNYHPSLAEDLAEDGVDIVSTANNHVLDRCAKGINLTLDALTSAGVKYTGTRQSEDEPWHTVTRWQGISVAWLACTQAGNDIQKDAIRSSNFVLRCDDTDYISSMVRTLASAYDTVIVTPHWGDEFILLNQSYIDKAHHWLEAGATAVIGNHPHITEMIEEYATRNGRRTVIAYSLGNFISHMGYGIYYKRKDKFYPRLRASPFLLIKLRRTTDGPTVLDSIRYVPLFVRRTPPKPCNGCKCPKPFGETIPREIQSCERFHVLPTNNSIPGVGEEAFKILTSVLGTENCLSFNQALEWIEDNN